MHSSCFSRGFHEPTPRFPPRAPVGDRSPASTVLSRRYDLLPPVPPHFVAFVWRYLRVHSFFSLLGGRVRRRGLELLSRYLQPGAHRGNDRISQVPGEPQVSVRHVQSTPAGLRAPDHYGAAARPLVSEQQRLPRKVFRRSIAWLSDSLSTLRSAGYPRPTQDSLPAVGQTLLDGLFARRVPMRGFRVLTTSHPPLPSLPGASRVALAVARQGSHRPVRARIRAYGSSADRFATPEGSPWLFVRVLWTCVRTSMCSACFPRSSLPADASLPSTGSSGASSPASTVLSKRYDFLSPIPPHFVAFAWRYLGVHSFGSLPGGRVRRRGLELVTR